MLNYSVVLSLATSSFILILGILSYRIQMVNYIAFYFELFDIFVEKTTLLRKDLI